jgi:FAD/FMN-containing dehydrogenase
VVTAVTTAEESEAYRPPRQPLVPPGGVEVFDRDMTVTAAGDVPLAAVQQRLAEFGQWLAIDGNPAQPVGRLVEINSTGPLRLGYGAWRDLLLGCQFRNGRGELITAGGRTVKNVAGYDLTKFMVGQQGIFGQIVTITARTYQRPAGALLVEREPDVRAVSELLTTPLRPQWAILTADRLRLGYLGDQAALEYWASKMPGERRSLERDSEHRVKLFSCSHDRGVTIRASVPPARLREFTAAAAMIQWGADAAFGIVRGCCDERALPALRQAARAGGGIAWRETGESIGDIAAGNPAQHQLLLRLRDAFAAGSKP